MVGGLTPGGDHIATPQPGALWAKITGQATGTNRYAWTQIDDGDTAAFDTGLADSFAATGTSAATGAPAYEINGRTGVAVGTRVLLYPAGDLTFYVFASPVTGTGAAASGADSCGWTAGATTATCLRMTVVSVQGACSGVSTSQSIEMTWDVTDSRYESSASAFTGTGSGGTGQVTLDVSGAAPVATIDGVTGKYMGCSGDGGLVFAFGGSVLCGGTSAVCADFFTVRFDCECCSIAGWDGEGWYCTEDGVLNLTDADRCDTAIVIVSGVYADEATAEAACATYPLAPSVGSCPDPGNMVPGQGGTFTVAPSVLHYFRATGLTASSNYKVTVSATGRDVNVGRYSTGIPCTGFAVTTDVGTEQCFDIATGVGETEIVLLFQVAATGSGSSTYTFLFEAGTC